MCPWCYAEKRDIWNSRILSDCKKSFATEECTDNYQTLPFMVLQPLRNWKEDHKNNPELKKKNNNKDEGTQAIQLNEKQIDKRLDHCISEQLHE